MDRRAFISGIALGILSLPAGEAQPAGRVYRIGLLDGSESDAGRQVRWNAFHQRMRELGYIEGQNVTFERRWAQGDPARVQRLAVELVGLKVDIIVVEGGIAAVAARKATSTIPIVMTTGDPVATGLVASLGRPGGNVTGMTSIFIELAGKRVELLKTVAPRASRIAILWDGTSPGNDLGVHETEAAAKRVGLTTQIVPVRSPAEFETAFATVVRDRAEALVISGSSILFPHRRRLAELAVTHRLPTVANGREYVAAGSLAGYGPDYPDLCRRAADFVVKILKGAKPGDLPIEQPTKFELAINLKTAKALGLTIPPSLLLRADQVIQ